MSSWHDIFLQAGPEEGLPPSSSSCLRRAEERSYHSLQIV